MSVFQVFDPLLFLVLGVALVAFGIYVRVWGQHKTPNPDSQAYWRRQLWTWRVIDYDGATHAVAEDIQRANSAINAFAIICAGVTVILSLLAYTAIVTVVTGDPSFTPAVGVSMAAILGPTFFGYGLGYVVSVRRLRARQCRGVSYGDLRRRYLSDYRSPLFLLAPALALVCTVWVTLALVPSFDKQLYIEPVGYDRTMIPYHPWLLGLLPATMLLIFVVGEAIMRRIATLSRLLVTSDPVAALRADEMLRALTITIVQGWELMTIGNLGTAQWSLLSTNLFAHHSYGSAHGIIGFYAFLPAVISIVGPLLFICRGRIGGRIGGRITGWPRQGTRVAL